MQLLLDDMTFHRGLDIIYIWRERILYIYIEYCAGVCVCVFIIFLLLVFLEGGLRGVSAFLRGRSSPL